MSNPILANIVRFFFLILFQVLVFSSFHFFGYINPFPYVLFVLLFPVNGNKSYLVISSFFLGLTLDMFLNSGGIHAAACLIIAYFRPFFFKFAFGLSYEYQTIKILGRFTKERFSFLVSMILVHHFVLFTLEAFKFSLIFNVLSKTFLSTIFTALISLIIIYLIKPSRKK